MSRATNGPATRQRRNRTLKAAKGYRQGRRNLFKMAKVTVMRAEVFAFAGRQQKKRQFRSLWITRLTAALKPLGLRYSAFIHGVQKAGIKLNRKELSELAMHDPATFESICGQAQKALA
ncbi:MAG: 50S ribosomal protein L20 [Planctomycetes bacterium]|nr:50S ribosomal protein L20 [Planctomycetota bacterium]MCC7396206.1 50S ribosomal protein L20 [Planctomycetota bacterium]